MTACDLQSVLVTTLVRLHGGDRRRLVLGDVRVYSLDTHPHCNWSIAPSGTYGDVERVERLIDDMRGQYPILTPN